MAISRELPNSRSRWIAFPEIPGQREIWASHVFSVFLTLGLGDVDWTANGIGFLSQTYEGTAALIGNTLLALAKHEADRAAVRTNPGLMSSVVQEVLRYDPPTQSTRRFVAEDGTVAGQPMRQGDTILVMLGAASRDPAANLEPDRFDIFRKVRRIVSHLLAGVEFERLEQSKSYRRSIAVRIPVFGIPE
jgi:cytochrome P450